MPYPVPYTWTVSGILLQNGTPFSQGKLEAYNRLADGSLDWMAECSPAGDGSYSLIFSSSAFQKGDNSIDHPNLVIRLYDYQNNLLWESDTYAAMETPFELGTIDIANVSTDDVWSISGVVLCNPATPLQAGTVYVYDVWNDQPVLLKQTTLNTNGYFSCTYEKAAFQKQGVTRTSPNLRIVVRDLSGQELTTYDVPAPISVNHSVKVILNIIPASLASDECKVYGTVKNTLNYPLKDNISVAAFCLYYKEPATGSSYGTFEKVMLGTPTETDAFGHYEIGYSAASIPLGLKLDGKEAKGKDKASIFAEVKYGQGGTTPESNLPQTFYSAPLVFNGQSVQEINFVLDLETDKPVKSEFESLNDVLKIYYQTVINNNATIKKYAQDKISEFLASNTQLPLVIGRESLEQSKVYAYFKAFQLAHEMLNSVEGLKSAFNPKTNLTDEENYEIVFTCAEYLYPLILNTDVVDVSTLLTFGLEECKKEIKSAITENAINSTLSAEDFKSTIWMNLQKSINVAKEQEDTFSAFFVLYMFLTKELTLQSSDTAIPNSIKKEGRRGRPTLLSLNSVKDRLQLLLDEFTESESNYRDLIERQEKSNSILSSSEVDDLKFLIDLGDFCNWYPDLVVSIYTLLHAENCQYKPIAKLDKDVTKDDELGAWKLEYLLKYDEQVNDFSANTTAFWCRAVNDAAERYSYWCHDVALALPLDQFPGTTAEEQKQIAVRTLKERLKAKFPQTELNSKFENSFSSTDDDEKSWNALVQKLQSDAWKDFDLNSSDIDLFLQNSLAKHNQDSQSPLAEADETEIKKIKIIQRLYRLTDNPEAIAYLIKNGFESASSIALMDEERFVAEHGLGMGDKELATNIHRLAKNFVANATLDIERYHGSLNEADNTIISIPRGLQETNETTATNTASNPKASKLLKLSRTSNVATSRLKSKNFANWKTLFGRINRNTGTQNQSILSASAYLLDLLEFLKQGHAYGRFISRRPDVKNLLMTKANAEVSLPTIDLAVELLESLVYRTSIQEWAIPLCNQTPDDATVADLRANPCKWDSKLDIDKSAMQVLDDRCFPLSLPRNFYADRLVSIFDNLSLNPCQVAHKLHLDENHAVLLKANQKAVLSTDFDQNQIEPSKLWGLEDNGNQGIFFPDKSRQIEAETRWFNVLCNLAFVLDRAKITYEEFAEIFTSDVFAGSGTTLNVDSESFQLADVNGYRINFEVDADAEKFFRKLSVFVRRRATLGWSTEDVAKTWNCNPDDLADIQELKTRLNLTATEAAILLDKVTLTIDDLKSIFAIDSLFDEYGSDFDELKRNNEKLRYQLATAAKICLEIELQDALLILQKWWRPETYPTASDALETGLNILYKYKLWISRNGLSVDDYFFLSEINFPVGFGSREFCNATIDELEILNKSSLSVSDLKSILDPQSMADEESAEFAKEVGDAIQASIDECMATTEVDGVSAIDYETSILNIMKSLGREDAEDVFNSWKNKPEEITEDYKDSIESIFANLFWNLSVSKESDYPWYSAISNEVVFYEKLTEELQAERLLTLLSEKFSVDTEVLLSLLKTLHTSENDSETDWDVWQSKISAENPQINNLCNHIFRCAALYQFTQTLDMGFEWNWSSFAIANVNRYETIKNVVYAFAASSQILGEVYKYNELNRLETLDKKLLISSESAVALFTKAGIVYEQNKDGLITSVNIDSPAAWCKFADLLYLYKKTNTLPGDLEKLLDANDVVYSLSVEKFEKNLRQTKTNSEWNKFIQGVNDKIRQLKRDVLAAVVCNDSQMPGTASYYPSVFVDENDIYSYYLMDVKMEPDMAISRTVQAVSCIQLFVQRALMGLEGSYTLNDTQKEQWEWMKNFQVWVANRKVFLYPENWIDGDLREDKTPFFLELEERLAEIGNDQNAMTEALGDYLKKVCDTSEMDIIGACKQDGGSAAGVLYTLHIVGRTRGEPHAYYYRKYEATALYGGSWTPWEELPLEIDGAAVQPAILNGRLYIVWLQVVQGQRQRKKGDSSTDEKATATIEYYAEIKLKWAYFTGAKWSSVKVSKQALYDISENQLNYLLGDNENLDDRYFFVDVSDNSDTLNLEIWRTFPKFTDTQTVISVPVASSQPTVGTPEDAANASPTTYILKTVITRNYEEGQRINHIGNLSLASDGTESVSYQYDLEGNRIAFHYGELVSDHVPRNCKLVGNMFYSSSNQLVLQDGTKIFDNTRGPFKLLSVNMGFVKHADTPFFLMDSKGTYLICTVSGDGGAGANSIANYRVEQVSNPQASEFHRRFVHGGTKWLYNRETEALPVSDSYYYSYSYYNYYFSVYLGYYTAGDWQAWDLSQTLFENSYMPTALVAEPYPSATVDFSWGSATSIYNWELFFFVPMLLADKMLSEQNYEAALNWLQLVFDPRIDLSNYERTKRFVRDLPKGAKYWKFLPFFANQDADKSILSDLSFPTPHDALPDRQAILLLQDRWKNDPFDPQMIARYRPVAYQKYVVMKYLDALIGLGDQLFTQDTTESVNLAVQMYVLAAEILGPKSAEVPDPKHKSKLKVIDLLNYGNDVMNNAFITYEDTMLTGKCREKETPQRLLPGKTMQLANTTGMMFYFNVPRNETLMGYWDTVADRLYKIRNSLNIEGVKRTLALFAPPIDPAMLVKAKASGVSISEALADASSALPYYRFKVMVEKAKEIVRDIQQMGRDLLSAFEKYDYETLALLRVNHEKTALMLQKTLAEMEVTELERELETTETEEETLQAEQEQQAGFFKKSEKETKYEKALDGIKKVQEGIESVRKAASVAAKIPDLGIGAIMNGLGGPSFDSIAYGGSKIAEMLINKAESKASEFAQKQVGSTISKLLSEQERTEQSWTMQKTAKANQIKVVQKKKLVDQIKIDYINKQVENLEREIELKDEMYEHLSEKYTNKELYKWLKTEIGKIYKILFQLAVKVARKAEKCYHFEIGDTEENPKSAKSFIKGSGSYWDGLYSGLLAGEKLLADLHAMEVAFLENDRNELEITRPVSLWELENRTDKNDLDCPQIPLTDLRDGKDCTFTIPESLFSKDFPDQYFRRIRDVRVEIIAPNYRGHYLNAQLSLTENFLDLKGIRDKIGNRIGTQTMATSTAHQESGKFDFRFGSDKFLPFEGAGAVDSKWSLEITGFDNTRDNDEGTNHSFDFSKIEDVIIHLSYTARMGKTQNGGN